MAAEGVYGREEELERLRSFFAVAAAGAFVLQGEAGIGKTTLFGAAQALARAAGWRVLAAGPTEAESRLSFGALGDLFDGCLEEVLPLLPAPQRRALRVALLLEEPVARRADPRGVAMAVTGSLRALAAEAPVLVAIDDVQWLDKESAAALAFAARRLADAHVAFLVAERVSAPSVSPLGLEQACAGRLEQIHLGPLTLGALHEFLRTGLGTSFPRPVLRRIDHLSAGNPFFALELARSAISGKSLDEDLPPNLGVLIRGRLEGLPAGTRSALLAAALVSEPTLALLQHVVDPGDLEPAFAEGVLVAEGERVRFSHPLLALAARTAQSPLAERALHRRLAELVPTLEERARHLAAAAIPPDGEVADVLHEAARSARRRGAPAAAAELAEAAIQLMPPDDVDLRSERALDAAVAHFESGDSARAQAILESLIDELPASPRRAEALWRLGTILRERNDATAQARLEQGLRETGGSTALAAVLHKELAWITINDGTVDDACSHATLAWELAERLGDESLQSEVAGALLYSRTAAGRDIDSALVERALELERRHDRGYLDSTLSAARIVAYRLFLDLRLDEAATQLGALRAQAAARGDDAAEFRDVYLLAFVSLFAGRWRDADALAGEAMARAEQRGASLREALYVRAAVDAHLGRVEAATRTAERGLALLPGEGPSLFQTRFLLVLGFLELSRNNAAAAAAHLRRAGSFAQEAGVRDAAMARFRPDEAEALIAIGELDAAAAVLDWFEARGAEAGRTWAFAVAARPRGLLAAARGDTDAALEALECSREGLAELPLPFEQARTLLAIGATRRRARQKRQARDALDEALTVFEELGAALWVTRTREELERIGGRPKASSSELTASERHVAALVAEGRSNKEVAALLSISARTVENHLAHIYDKLGVRSRTALAALQSQHG